MKIRRDVLNLTLPILMEQTFIMSMGVINTMMAGHVGKEAVSAIGMVDSLNFIFINFFSALAIGGTVVVAHYAGQRNIVNANEASKQALGSGIIISALFALIIWIFRNPLLRFLYSTAEQEVINNALTYFKITLLTYPLIAITTISCGVLRGAGDTRTPMKVNILMNVINVVLSYLLIYGLDLTNAHLNIHISSLGVKGAALGIAIARTAGTLAIITTLLRGSKFIKLTGIRHFKFNMEILKNVFNIGVPASVESLLFNGGKLITQIMIVGMGTVSIASNYIASSIVSLINIPGIALSLAAPTIVGQNMGKGDSEEAKNLLWYITKLSSACLMLIGIISLPFARLLPALYTQNRDIIDMTAGMIRLNAVFIVTWSFSFVLPSGLKGAGDAKYTMVTAIIGMWLFRITLGYILGVPLKLGVPGVWMGMYTDWLVRGALYYIRLKNDKWKENVVIKPAEEAA